MSGIQKKIAVLTVGRSDFSILFPLIRRLQGDPTFDVGLWVGGGHFDPNAGNTIDDVKSSGVPIWAAFPTAAFGSTELATIGMMSSQLGQVETALSEGPRPDLVIILGDRFEAVSIGLALVPTNIPIAHISGGSVTEGAIDDVFRHCLTKMSKLHFCDVPDFATRIHRMGEAAETIFAVGALGLDGIVEQGFKPFAKMRDAFEISDAIGPGYALATVHPETRSLHLTEQMTTALIQSLIDNKQPTIFTYPNADPYASKIIELIEQAAQDHEQFHVVKNFGRAWFYTAMHNAGIVVGNSSSGIIEAASFKLPVLNIGDRQKGRYCGENVVHCGIEPKEIADGIAQVLEMRDTNRLKDFINPYGDGKAAERVHEVLRGFDWSMATSAKPFADFNPFYNGNLGVDLQ